MSIAELPRPITKPLRVQGPPRLCFEIAGTLMTPEEFDAVEEYDELYNYELIHGVLVVNPLPLESEVDPNEFLGYLLQGYREHHPQGAALNATLPERHVPTSDSRRKADSFDLGRLGPDARSPA